MSTGTVERKYQARNSNITVAKCIGTPLVEGEYHIFMKAKPAYGTTEILKYGGRWDILIIFTHNSEYFSSLSFCLKSLHSTK